MIIFFENAVQSKCTMSKGNELDELIEAIFADMETNEKPDESGDRKEHSQ